MAALELELTQYHVGKRRIGCENKADLPSALFCLFDRKGSHRLKLFVPATDDKLRQRVMECHDACEGEYCLRVNNNLTLRPMQSDAAWRRMSLEQRCNAVLQELLPNITAEQLIKRLKPANWRSDVVKLAERCIVHAVYEFVPVTITDQNTGEPVSSVLFQFTVTIEMLFPDSESKALYDLAI